jgi:hypothetical protein
VILNVISIGYSACVYSHCESALAVRSSALPVKIGGLLPTAAAHQF